MVDLSGRKLMNLITADPSTISASASTTTLSSASTQPAQSSVMRFRHQKATVNDDDHLEQALQRNPRDFNKLDNYMHQFKGSSSSIGAKTVKVDCQQFREYCNAGNVEGD
ncbi:histidine-containing phosphotransfer protein 4-like [Malus sylvestris]|uniref:histidine-containing phosphotransfer protein 4-like n=1 Tax=Malus sylvestris TaxID=3752 RepID=UPI0021AC5013|nr:histidine-containing phosphotransfer protein 4-like [Malus sylvestris]